MIDLHTHSRVSDGSATPTQLIELASSANCQAIALTDHDTFDGIHEARKRAEELDIELIPGVEVSCDWIHGTLHLLVYFVDDSKLPLTKTLLEMQGARELRNRQLVDFMASDGVDITYEELLVEGGGSGIGRPHFAALMLKLGIVSSIQEAFDNYLEVDQKYYIEKKTYPPEELIALAISSGGVPVLAHPYSVANDPNDVAGIVEELTSHGLAGLETQYGRYSLSQRKTLNEIAKSNSLVITGGSDFHGTYKPDLSIGVGRGDLNVPYDILIQLKERRTRLLDTIQYDK